MIMAAKIKLDKFQLMWLFEGAAGKSHLRWDIYKMFIDNIYPQLDDDEREFLYTYIKRDTAWLWENKTLGDETPYKYWQQVLARFNPANQYMVTAKDGEKTATKQAYKWDGKLYVKWNGWFADEYITEVKQCKFKGCNNNLCAKCHDCLRYINRETTVLDSDNSQWLCEKCDMLIESVN